MLHFDGCDLSCDFVHARLHISLAMRDHHGHDSCRVTSLPLAAIRMADNACAFRSISLAVGTQTRHTIMAGRWAQYALWLIVAGTIVQRAGSVPAVVSAGPAGAPPTNSTCAALQHDSCWYCPGSHVVRQFSSNSTAACCAACDQMAVCKAFTLNVNMGTCFLKARSSQIFR